MKNPFQAKAAAANTPAVYPVIPATWPNRAVRRAVQYRRVEPTMWAIFFDKFPKLRPFIRTGVMPA